jgi:hypothetical protein
MQANRDKPTCSRELSRPRRNAVAKLRRAARKDPAAVTVTQPADNDWWAGAIIATIFTISTAAVWTPVILGAAG